MRVISIMLIALLLSSCGGGGNPGPGIDPPPVQWEAAGTYNVWPASNPSDAQEWFIVDAGTSPNYELYRESVHPDGFVGVLTFDGNSFNHTGRTDVHGTRVDISGEVNEAGLESTWIEYRDEVEIDSLDWVGERIQ